MRSDKYQLVSRAVLHLLPDSGPGLTAEDLVAGLDNLLPLSLFPGASSIRWFMTAVRIDLEARGQIQRVGPRKPARYIAGRIFAAAAETPATRTILIPDWATPDRPAYPRTRAL